MSSKVLIRELNKHTPVGHPDKAQLTKALASIEAVLQKINSQKSLAETIERTCHVSSVVEGAQEHVQFSPERLYLLEGRLLQRKKRKNLGGVEGDVERFVFLFRDSMLLCRPIGKVHRLVARQSSYRFSLVKVVPLDSLAAVLVDPEHEWRIQLVSKDDVVLFVLVVPKECGASVLQNWIESFKKCVVYEQGAVSI